MRRLRVTVIDLTDQGPHHSAWTDPYGRLMNANYASIMPQAVAVWAEELGHDVHYLCYTGFEGLGTQMAGETDVLFIGGFTTAAETAYAISNVFRKAGAVTAIGGPHARCFPEDAARFFDYVLGFTGKPEIDAVLRDAGPHRPTGRYVSALRQPPELPSLRARWKFTKSALDKAPFLKLVPMIGSMGCPYTCSFCIDSTVAYQPLDFDELKADLRFLREQLGKAYVGWHDPNFGVRFDEYLGAIEEAVPPGSMHFVAESSLSLLSEPNLKRMQKNGFIGMLPGIESWYEFGNKSRATRVGGMDKVRQVADHINMVLDHIPFVQTNFILGLDCDEGSEPFELTKKFMDLAPGAYPAFSLLTAYGRAAPANLDLMRQDRVLPVPFQMLDSNHATNVTPKNYGWEEFYDLTVDVTRHALRPRTLARRFRANKHLGVRFLKLVRGATNDRVAYQKGMRERLTNDLGFRAFFEGETRRVPEYFLKRVQKRLGGLWPALPAGVFDYDPLAYLKSEKPQAIPAE